MRRTSTLGVYLAGGLCSGNAKTVRFVALPKRGIVERTIAWLNRCRRPGKDWECLNQNANAFLKWA